MVSYATLLLVLHCSSTKGPTRLKMTFRSVVPIDVLGALTNQGRPNKGPANAHPLPKPMQLALSLSSPRRRPQEGSAEGLEQPVLQQMPLPPRGQPLQGGLAEVCLLSALEAALEKAPQTRNFLEEDLPRVSVSCQAGFKPGGVLTSRGRPHKGLADGYLLPEPRGQPQQLGLAEVLPERVRNLSGPRPSEPRVQPQQLGLADDPRQPMLQQMAAPPRARPQQVGLAEVLPGRVRNLPGPRTSCKLQPSA